MDEHFAALIAACLAFVGTHFLLSHPWRAGMIKRFGERGFQAVYSVVALLTFAWVIRSFSAIPADGHAYWNGQADIAWLIASLIMLPASVLLIGSFQGNPAMPAPNAKKQARRTPRGVFKVTRHPMMWSFALWAVAHLLVSPTPRVLILTVAIAMLALLGAYLQDNKKLLTMGGSWEIWERHTTFFPRFSNLLGAGVIPLGGGVLFWLLVSGLHSLFIGMPVGVWRWL